jgi:hypothetical protein
MNTSKSYPPEFRERAMRLALDKEADQLAMGSPRLDR